MSETDKSSIGSHALRSGLAVHPCDDAATPLVTRAEISLSVDCVGGVQWVSLAQDDSQIRYTKLETHCHSAFILVPTTAPQAWLVTHQHYTLHGLRCRGATDHCFNTVITTTTTQRSGGPLKGPLTDTFKKGRFYFIQTSSPKNLQTVSVLSQSSRLVSLLNKPTESPASSPHSHHVATERAEEFTQFCSASSSNRALPTRGAKTKNRQTTHTTQAQIRCNGSCLFTHTAVAVLSCNSFCKLIMAGFPAGESNDLEVVAVRNAEAWPWPQPRIGFDKSCFD